jgi:hypothetical protein
MTSITNKEMNLIQSKTLSFWGTKALIYQTLLVGFAVGLPAIAHLTGAPVRFLLPMHWPVILAGLVYGWRGGLLTGLLAPSTNFLVTGFPLTNILPAMTVELAVYGFVSGYLREKVRLNIFASIAIALLLGRVSFMITVLFQADIATNYFQYLKSAMIPGLIAAVAQVLILPFIARWWINKGQ